MTSHVLQSSLRDTYTRQESTRGPNPRSKGSLRVSVLSRCAYTKTIRNWLANRCSLTAALQVSRQQPQAVMERTGSITDESSTIAWLVGITYRVKSVLSWGLVYKFCAVVSVFHSKLGQHSARNRDTDPTPKSRTTIGGEHSNRGDKCQHTNHTCSRAAKEVADQ